AIRNNAARRSSGASRNKIAGGAIIRIGSGVIATSRFVCQTSNKTNGGVVSNSNGGSARTSFVSANQTVSVGGESVNDSCSISVGKITGASTKAIGNACARISYVGKTLSIKTSARPAIVTTAIASTIT